ncbi:LAME_0F03862g1_1 [Lachancea meyersii CBS 8951]|uniref:Pantoate--beta-alanine ligase n=1 Tax=Lachancea meyersii CBS 8951 TaxID=1266667 RepID=A0A1G4JRZ5_9SACH|nr:LAME_0F03862g1_1 [Lachancea meyersii CBS 8951]
MRVLKTVKQVVEWRISNINTRTQSSGFVPTMGCLHEGHVSLIRASKNENEFTIVSIFVNPSQFAPSEDLDKYPRTLQNDLELLEAEGVDVCFLPSAQEIYPQGIPLDVKEQRGPFVSVLGVSEQLEGRTRPNFFRGVATVVTKLLNVVLPTHAYFGQKDFQQFTVLKVMTEELFMNTKIKMMPIVRGSKGLALSSRNRYLCAESRDISKAIYQGLTAAASVIQTLEPGAQTSRSELLGKIHAVWAPHVTAGDFTVDYVSVAHFRSLEELEYVSRTNDVVISCAVYVQDREDKTTKVRLIDNVVLTDERGA